MDVHSYEQLNLEHYDYIEPSTPHPKTSRPAERRQMHSLYVNAEGVNAMVTGKQGKMGIRRVNLILAIVTLLLLIVAIALITSSLAIVVSRQTSYSMSHSAGANTHNQGTEFQVTVLSDGCCSYENTESLNSIFFIDGAPICLTWKATTTFYRRGFNFAVFDLPFGGRPILETCTNYDTWLSYDEDAKMKQFMDGIPDGRMVLISIMDDGARYLRNASREAMKRFINMDKYLAAFERDSVAFVGYTKPAGECFPGWVQGSRMPFDNTLNDAPSVRLEVTGNTMWTC